MEDKIQTEIQEKIKQYENQIQFEKNPLGGQYKILNESTTRIQVDGEERALQNTCYSFYVKGEYFPFHRLSRQEEHFFHIDGGALTLLKLNIEQQKIEEIKIGKDILNGEVLNYRMEKGSIFCCICDSPFVLMGVICTPGWFFYDNHVFTIEELEQIIPDQKSIYEKYTQKQQ